MHWGVADPGALLDIIDGERGSLPGIRGQSDSSANTQYRFPLRIQSTDVQLCKRLEHHFPLARFPSHRRECNQGRGLAARLLDGLAQQRVRADLQKRVIAVLHRTLDRIGEEYRTSE